MKKKSALARWLCACALITLLSGCGVLGCGGAGGDGYFSVGCGAGVRF